MVGSAIMRLIEKNIGNASLEIQLESFIRETPAFVTPRKVGNER